MVLHSIFVVCLIGCEAASSVLETVTELQKPTDPSHSTYSPERAALPSDGHVDGLVRESGSVDGISICSFNIQFLGNSRSCDDRALAGIVAPYDIVVVQERVSPPYAGAVLMTGHVCDDLSSFSEFVKADDVQRKPFSAEDVPGFVPGSLS